MKFQSPIPVRWSLALLIAALRPAPFAQVPQDPGSKAIPLSKVERKNKAPVSRRDSARQNSQAHRDHAPERAHGAGAGGSPAAAGDRAAEHSGRGRVERSRRCARPRQHHGHHVEGRHQDAVEQTDRRADRRARRHHRSAGAVGIGDRHLHRVGLERQRQPVDRARVRHPAESFVSRKRIEQAEAAHESSVAATALHGRLPDAGALQSRGLWQSSRRHYLAHAAGSRQNHARHARRVARHALCA